MQMPLLGNNFKHLVADLFGDQRAAHGGFGHVDFKQALFIPRVGELAVLVRIMDHSKVHDLAEIIDDQIVEHRSAWRQLCHIRAVQIRRIGGHRILLIDQSVLVGAGKGANRATGPGS